MLKKSLLIGLMVLALVSACTKSERAKTSAIAPDFTLQALGGQTVHLAELKGKVVLLEFWASWCPPCRDSIPGMKRMFTTYHDRGLMVLGVSLDMAAPETIRSFAREYGINYPILLGTEDVATRYMVNAIPTVFLVNKDGIITQRYLGGASDDVLERDIRALL